jgi:hypothetical protein
MMKSAIKGSRCNGKCMVLAAIPSVCSSPCRHDGLFLSVVTPHTWQRCSTVVKIRLRYSNGTCFDCFVTKTCSSSCASLIVGRLVIHICKHRNSDSNSTRPTFNVQRLARRVSISFLKSALLVMAGGRTPPI